MCAEEDDHSGLWHEWFTEWLPLRVLRRWTMGTFQVHLLEGGFQ